MPPTAGKAFLCDEMYKCKESAPLGGGGGDSNVHWKEIGSTKKHRGIAVIEGFVDAGVFRVRKFSLPLKGKANLLSSTSL